MVDRNIQLISIGFNSFQKLFVPFQFKLMRHSSLHLTRWYFLKSFTCWSHSAILITIIFALHFTHIDPFFNQAFMASFWQPVQHLETVEDINSSRPWDFLVVLAPLPCCPRRLAAKAPALHKSAKLLKWWQERKTREVIESVNVKDQNNPWYSGWCLSWIPKYLPASVSHSEQMPLAGSAQWLAQTFGRKIWNKQAVCGSGMIWIIWCFWRKICTHLQFDLM